jgi:hypothetical protein
MEIEFHHADLIIPNGKEAEAREFYCGLLKIKEDLILHGFKVKEQDALPGMIRIESEDPFGHRLEFLQVV